ncbi:SDR family oxidoreductase [Subtercola boreus]|uniref:NAD-dependent dehydratase n=1 Tax=Subtercola boreus TaxID=120213 RepID=A0A3E0WDH8_9MICO|nr:SDR family oxidoreductase [Subtercola boreus]RFA22503.1 NAD-dependent dehydratase [Subtercola boreus]RFA23273.1 NAD-dependent dehydratase [Subtercola boreus]RFA29081.1 NAD-dependent dehydratase [Subtercola boreus]
MRIAIAGGHGAIALHLEKLLSDQGHEAVAIIRNADQGADVLAAGGIPLVVDLENTDAQTLARDLQGVDAVVFAAGAGPNSTAERKLTVDRDGAILLADAAEVAGIGRYVLISSMGADDFDPDSEEVFQVYLQAKSAADANVRSRNLEWTIIRPGGLTDDAPTGEVTLAESTGRGTIPRADVAALVAAALLDGIAIGAQFEAISGDIPIPDALAAVRY